MEEDRVKGAMGLIGQCWKGVHEGLGGSGG